MHSKGERVNRDSCGPQDVTGLCHRHGKRGTQPEATSRVHCRMADQCQMRSVSVRDSLIGMVTRCSRTSRVVNTARTS